MNAKRIARAALIVGVLIATAPSAWAQSGIAGVVKDTTGGVLPGVTVEASSDVLIEKVRTATTDSQGQYRIIDLRPGTYIVTFTLTGFNTYRQTFPICLLAGLFGFRQNRSYLEFADREKLAEAPRVVMA